MVMVRFLMDSSEKIASLLIQLIKVLAWICVVILNRMLWLILARKVCLNFHWIQTLFRNHRFKVEVKKLHYLTSPKYVRHALGTVWAHGLFDGFNLRIDKQSFWRMYTFDLRYNPYKTGIKKAPIIKIGAFESGRRN